MGGMRFGTRVFASLLGLVSGSAAADAADRQVKNSASMRMERIFSLPLPEAICAKRNHSGNQKGPAGMERGQYPTAEKNILRT